MSLEETPSNRPIDELLTELGLPLASRDKFWDCLTAAAFETLPIDELAEIASQQTDENVSDKTFAEVFDEPIDESYGYGKGLEHLLIPSGGAVPSALLAAWRRHILTNLGHLPQVNCGGGASLGWREPPPLEVQDFLKHNPIEMVESLGSEVTAAYFLGPHVNSIIIAYGTVRDPLQIEFLIYHLFLHRAAGHVLHNGFDCRLEYLRGAVPVELNTNPSYLREEAIANDGACCLWDDTYIPGERMSLFSKILIRGALATDMAQRPLIRSVLRNRPGLRSLIWKVAHSLLPKGVERFFSPFCPRVKYVGPAAVVRGTVSDTNVYLLCVDVEGRVWKRWIPSERVWLDHLGVLDADIVKIPDEDLRLFEEGRMLINVEEVDYMYQVLLASAGSVFPSPFGRYSWFDSLGSLQAQKDAARLVGLKQGQARTWKAEIRVEVDRLLTPEEASFLEGNRIELATPTPV